MPAIHQNSLMASLRRLGCPLAAAVIGLLIWQALAAGLVGARAAALTAVGLGDRVICHSGSDHGAPADRGTHEQDCCSSCLVAATPVLPGQLPPVRLDHVRIEDAVPLHGPPLARSPRAVRAGWSQAPPTLT